MTESEPLTVCGVEMEHVSGFIWIGAVRGWHVTFNALRSGKSCSQLQSIAGQAPAATFTRETHEQCAAEMTKWINEHAGDDAAAAAAAEEKDPMTTTESESAAALAARVTCELSLEDLVEHPHRDHVRTDADAKEMAESIRLHGLIEPLLVQKSSKTIIAGHRRKWGLEVLGTKTARVELLDVPDDVALVLLQVSNNHRLRPDPMKESATVAALLALPGWSIARVADALRVKARWVARRANLRNLGPDLEKLAKPGKALADWPVEWLEQLAILAKDAQAVFAKRYTRPSYDWPRVHSQEDLDRILAEELHVLGKAPFDTHDPELVPRAGACVVAIGGTGSSCKKTTVARPGLFDDDQVGGDVKTARCCDSGCWAAKLKAHIAADVAAAKAEHGKDLVVVRPRGTTAGVDAALRDVNALDSYQVTKVKGTDKGARPALLVNEDGSLTSGYVRTGDAATGPRSSSSSSSSKGAKDADERSPAQKLKDSKAGIENRRTAHVVDAVKAWLEDEANEKTTPSWKDTRELLVRFNTEPSYKYNDSNAKKDLDEIAAIAADDLALARDLWPRLRDDMSERLKRWGGAGPRLKDQHALALWVAPKLGLDARHLEGDAVVDIPDPKWWPDSARTPDPFRAERHAAIMSGKTAAPAKGAKKAAPAAAPKKARKNPWTSLSQAEKNARVKKMLDGGKGKAAASKKAST